jgi:hypothetical protein
MKPLEDETPADLSNRRGVQGHGLQQVLSSREKHMLACIVKA